MRITQRVDLAATEDEALIVSVDRFAEVILDVETDLFNVRTNGFVELRFSDGDPEHERTRVYWPADELASLIDCLASAHQNVEDLRRADTAEGES